MTFVEACPICGVTDVYDGSERRCIACNVLLVCVTYTDGTADMQPAHVTARRPADWRTGRQRTRARWLRQGRR